jgi:hypothetical protein
MIQVVGLFLIAMVVMAIVGRLRQGLGGMRQGAKCPACGRHKIGKGPCPCGKGKV